MRRFVPAVYCALLMLALAPGASAATNPLPTLREVEHLRGEVFVQRGEFWYLGCSHSGPWVQYSYFAVKNLAPAIKHAAGHVDVVFTGRPALYYFARDHQWLDFGEPLSLTYHARFEGGAWKYTLEENDAHYCGLGETQHKPALADIPPVGEPLRIK